MMQRMIAMGSGGESGEQWDVYCTLSSTSQKTFNLGFKPKKLYVAFAYTSNNVPVCVYDESVSTTTATRWVQGSTDTLNIVPPNTSVVGLKAITDTGFEIYSGTNNPAFLFYAAQK